MKKRLPMVKVLNFHGIFYRISQTVNPYVQLSRRYCHFISDLGKSPLDKNFTLAPRKSPNNVAIFWDLDNKPPKSFPPYEVAIKLKKAATSFGIVRYMAAYANDHAFGHVPQAARGQGKERLVLNHLEKKGIINLCRVCGRKFYSNEKLMNHFKQLHEREHMKRVNQIESAKGKRRVNLVAKYSMKMQKYKKAARDIFNPREGYDLSDEVKQAGFLVWTVSEKLQAAGLALKGHMVDMMGTRRFQCVVLVSDNCDFVNVLKEAKLQSLKTVVVGDSNDGALKRVADASFSWTEILMGKAKKEAVSVVEKWNDRDILKRLEWRYDPELEKQKYALDGDVSEATEDEDTEDILDEIDNSCEQKEGSSAWWELDSGTDPVAAQSCK